LVVPAWLAWLLVPGIARLGITRIARWGIPARFKAARFAAVARLAGTAVIARVFALAFARFK
jgi:hypothetical protein